MQAEDSFQTELPVMLISLIGRALRAEIEVEINENDFREISITFRDQRSGGSSTVEMSKAKPADLDEVEYLLGRESSSFE